MGTLTAELRCRKRQAFPPTTPALSSRLYRVPPRLCPRCHTVLHREDEGSLVFCFNCGAPQVQLSEELREQAEQMLAAPDTSAAAPQPPIADEGLPYVTVAIQTAGIAGAVAGAITLLSYALAPVAVFSLLWAVSAPILSLRLFLGRLHHARVTASFAARLGFLSGLAVLLATTTINTIGLVLTRFALHAAAPLDTQLTAVFDQDRILMIQAFGTQAAPMLQKFAIPEYRAGLMLSGFALFAAVYLLYATAAGALAGFMRSRPR